MPEQIRFPYGNAFVFETPHLDRATNNLYQEQRFREQNYIRENAALDQAMQREFGKIRSVDTPEVIQNYNIYKDLKKKLLFDPKVKNDPQIYNQVQRQANLALQQTYQGINKSSELLEGAKAMDKDRFTRPNLYSDDYGEKRAQFWDTPMSQLAQHPAGDLSSSDTYAYKGSNTDWQKILNQATGAIKPVFSFEEKVGDKGLQTKVTPYSFGNTPAQVKESVLASMGQHRAGRDAEYLWDQLPQQEIETTIAQYKAIPQDKLQKMGLSSPQDLTPRNPQSKAENYASYLAMKYAISNEPKAGVPQYKTDIGAVEDYRQKGRLYMEAVRQGNREALVRMRHDYKQADKEQQAKMENGVYDEMKKDALKNPAKYKDVNGNETTNYVMSTTPDVQAILAIKDEKGHDTPIDQVVFTPDGYVKGVVYKRDENGELLPAGKDGKRPVDPKLSTKMLESEFKARWIKGIFGVKEAKAQTAGVASEAPTAIKTYNMNGKAYTHKQLNDMGYDDKEIEQYIKAGLLK